MMAEESREASLIHLFELDSKRFYRIYRKNGISKDAIENLTLELRNKGYTVFGSLSFVHGMIPREIILLADPNRQECKRGIENIDMDFIRAAKKLNLPYATRGARKTFTQYI
jgi:hypothetical protein